MRHEPYDAIISPLPSALRTLLLCLRIANRVNRPVDSPDRAGDSRSLRIPKPSNQQRRERCWVILVIVLVRALCAVEEVHRLLLVRGCGLDLLVRGVFVGVGDLGGLAEAADADAVPVC